MTKKSPISLEELANELCAQDNRETAYPLFCVEVKSRIYGEKLNSPDGALWCYCDDSCCNYEDPKELKEYLMSELDEFSEENQEKIKEFDPEWDTEILNWTRYEYEEYWEFDTAHLTEKGANDYLKINKHNLGEHRIYVTSQYRCHEFNDVVDYIKSWRDLEDIKI